MSRHRKKRDAFRVTTRKNQSLAKMEKQYPNINISISMNSDKYGSKRSPSIDYNLTDIDQESVSDKIEDF